MQKQIRRGLLVPGMIVSLATLLIACAPASTDAEPEPTTEVETETEAPVEVDTSPEITELAIGIKPIPGYAPIQAAVSLGYFAEEGLDVTLEVMGPGTTVPAVVGGSVQFSGNTWLAIVQGLAAGVELIPVAELERGTPGYAEFVVVSGSPAQELVDLDGLVVGVPESPGNCDLAALAVISEQNLGVEMSFVALPVPDMPGALARGDVAAACAPEPILGGLKASCDFRSVFDVFGDVYDGFPVSGVFTTQAFADENPNTVAAVKRALAKAKDAGQADPQVIRDAVLEYSTAPPPAVQGMTLPDYPDDDFSNLVEVSELLEVTGQIPAGYELPENFR